LHRYAADCVYDDHLTDAFFAALVGAVRVDSP
jgi:hypothetical protein